MGEEKKAPKEGLFKRIFGGGKTQPCCGGVQLEEIPEDREDDESKAPRKESS